MVDTCVSTGLPTPEFVEDRDYLVVRFARPIKAEGRLDDAEIVLSMIRNNPEIRQADTVTAVDGFLVEYTISGEDSVITDTLDVRVFIDMFCPDETQNMIADRTETISTPFGDAECTVLSNMHQGYGAEQWVSMDTGFLYKSETNRPDGIASSSVLKDTSLI